MVRSRQIDDSSRFRNIQPGHLVQRAGSEKTVAPPSTSGVVALDGPRVSQGQLPGGVSICD